MREVQQGFGYHPGAELVSGIVCPLGADHEKAVSTFSNYLQHYNYRANPIRLSVLFRELLSRLGSPMDSDPPSDPFGLARYKMEAGNSIRTLSGRDDFLALAAAREIMSQRSSQAKIRTRPKPLQGLPTSW